MHTGITSVAQLADMGAVYPFAGSEWLYALILLAFTLYFIVSQIRMERSDIDEDVANGRVYFARETLARFGSLEPGRREFLLRDQIRRADALYDQGIAGIGELRRGRRAIAAAADMYREVLRRLEAEGYGARPGRAVVRRRRKLTIAARAALRA